MDPHLTPTDDLPVVIAVRLYRMLSTKAEETECICVSRSRRVQKAMNTRSAWSF